MNESRSLRNVATTRILHLSENAESPATAKPWIWPLPKLDGVAPCIVTPCDPARGDAFVQIGYADRASSPDLIPVFAAQDGVITYAAHDGQRATLCLDHPGGWSTQYGELEHVLALSTDRFRRRRRVRVRAGDVLGHLRTSLRLQLGMSRLVDGDCVAVDPANVIHTWSVQPWFAAPRSRVLAKLAI